MVKDEHRQKHHRIAGYVLMALVVALVLMVTFIADIQRLFDRRYTIYAVFPTAPALTRGAPVWIAGREVGEVVRIGFLPLGHDTTPGLAVELELPWEERELVRRDSRVELSSARLVSDPVVNIAPGSPATAVLQPGDTLYARPSHSPIAVMNNFRHLWNTLDSLFAEIQEISPLVERQHGQFATLGSRFDAVRSQFAILSEGFATGTLSILSNRSELHRSLGQMNATIAEIGPALQRASTRYRDPELREAFQRLKSRADALSAQIDQLRELVANSSLTRFQTDSAIIKQLHRTKSQLDSLVAETKGSPLRFWF